MQYYLYEYADKYGPNSVCWIGPIPVFLTTDPETIQDVLKSKNCVNKPNIIYKNFALLLGSGVVTQSGNFINKEFRRLNLRLNHFFFLFFFYTFRTTLEQIS